MLLGKSGTGKSTSIKGLNPKETIVINVLGKRLPFKGSNSLYNKENKNFFIIILFILFIRYCQISSSYYYK